MSKAIKITNNKLSEKEKTKLSLLCLKDDKNSLINDFWAKQWKKLFVKLKYNTIYSFSFDPLTYISFNIFIRENFTLKNNTFDNNKMHEYSVFYQSNYTDDIIEIVYEIYELIEEPKLTPSKIKKRK